MNNFGGIQEETAIMQVPYMTLQENTERPVIITEGGNRLVPVAANDILSHWLGQLRPFSPAKRPYPQLWDGRATKRLVEFITNIGRNLGSDELLLTRARTDSKRVSQEKYEAPERLELPSISVKLPERRKSVANVR